MHRLKEVYECCKFEKLEIKGWIAEDELILLKLMENLLDSSHKHKILDRLQLSGMDSEASI